MDFLIKIFFLFFTEKAHQYGFEWSKVETNSGKSICYQYFLWNYISLTSSKCDRRRKFCGFTVWKLKSVWSNYNYKLWLTNKSHAFIATCSIPSIFQDESVGDSSNQSALNSISSYVNDHDYVLDKVTFTPVNLKMFEVTDMNFFSLSFNVFHNIDWYFIFYFAAHIFGEYLQSGYSFEVYQFQRRKFKKGNSFVTIFDEFWFQRHVRLWSKYKNNM